MFYHNINPTLFSIGPFEIRYYGLVYVFGFLLTYFYFLRKIKNKKIDWSVNDLNDFLLYIMLGVLIGSRLLYVLFYNPSYYIQNPLEVFYFWQGGMSFHGGFLGVITAAYLFIKKKNMDWKDFVKLTDQLAVIIPLILGIGRIANFINGELVGTVTSVPWAVKFPGYEGFRHPSQIYEALLKFFMFGVMLTLNKKEWKPGFLSWCFVFMYGFGRFLVNFFREPTQPFLGIDLGQWLSLAMGIIAVIVFYKFYPKEIKRIFTFKSKKEAD